MTFFKWDKNYESGNDIMDGDHKILVQMINDLYVEMAKGDGKKIVNSIVNSLVDYSKNHFRREEKLMKAFCYDGFEKHEAEHDEFIAKVSHFLKNINSDSITVDVAVFLKDWLSNHILTSDKKFAYYLDFKKTSDRIV
jgi:hemerythrin-like metal-binding protein